MKLKTPMKLIHENLLLTQEGDVWAYYLVKPASIANNNGEEKEKLKRTHAYFFNSLEKYKDFHIEMFPQDMNLSERFELLGQDFSPEAKEVANYYAQETVNLLNHEMGMVTTESYIVGVKLKAFETSDSIKEVIQANYNDMLRRIMIGLGFAMDVDASYLEQFKALESDLFENSMRLIGASRVSEELNVYLNRLNFIRDIDHNVRREGKRNDHFSITDSILDPSTDAGYIKLKNVDGESYVSFLPVAEFPINMGYSHLFEVAQKQKFPVELHIKGQFQELSGVSGMSAKADRISRRLKNNSKEAHLGGDSESKRLTTNRVVIKELQNDIDAGKPILKWLACFVVYGKTKAECKKRGDNLLSSLGVRKIKAYRPASDQLKLFYKLLQGEPLRGEKSYMQVTNTTAFAENLFAVSNRLGNKVGWYIGRVDDLKASIDLKTSIYASKKILLFNPIVANKGVEGSKTASPHIAVTGQTGKGKSFLVKLLFIYMSFLDMKLLYVDPKKEIRKWFERAINDPAMQKNYPLFVKHLKAFHYVTLDASNPDNWGVLDPIVFLKGSVAKDTAEAMIEQIYNTNGKDHAKTAILRAIKTVISRREMGEKVGMLNVIEILRGDTDKEIKSAGDLLYEMVTESVLQLGFSDGQNAGVDLQSRVNILEISGLDLPKADDNPEYYSDIEKKSVCLMLPLGKFCEKFGADEPEHMTAEVFDEAWIFSVAKGGKKILKSMKRVGRSQNNMLVYATQSVADISEEDDKGQFGVVFAYDEDSEREAILDHMQVENTEANRKMLSEMIQGQCLFRDIYGNVGKIDVHCPFVELTEAFKTVNKSKSATAEESYA